MGPLGQNASQMADKALIAPDVRIHSLPDGARMAVRVAGNAGRPLVLVHGWSMSGGAFGPQMALAEHGFQVIAPDLRGFGGTERGSGPLDIARMADDLQSLMYALEIRGALLVGWSMGASVVWELVSRPDSAAMAAGIASIDMTPKVQNGGGWSLGLSTGHDAAATQRALEAMVADWSSYCAAFVPRILAPGAPVRGPLPDLLARLALATSPDAAAEAWASLAAHDSRPALAAINCPALVVHGARSQLYSAEVAVHAASTLAHGQLHCFTQSGHAPHLEEAEAFNALITRFAQGLTQEPQARHAAPAAL